MTHEQDIKRQWDGIEKSPAGRVAHKVLAASEWCSIDRANATALGALAVLLIVAVWRMAR